MANWTDNPATSSVHIRAGHINEIVHTVNRNRAVARMSPYPWTAPNGVSSQTLIRVPHFADIRTAILQHMSLPNWTVGSAPGTSRQISARDINDLRNWCDQFSTALGLPTGPDPWSCGSTTNAQGIDVSDFQWPANGTVAYWTAARNTGVGFAWIKATEGINYISTQRFGLGLSGLQQIWSAANQVFGSATYLYHFIDWQYSGTQQADFFYNTINQLNPQPAPLINTLLAADIEDPNGSSSVGPPTQQVVNDFMNELGLDVWKEPGIYGNLVMYVEPDTWASGLGNPSTWAYVPLWLAGFQGQVWCPQQSNQFGAWPDWFMAQYGTIDFWLRGHGRQPAPPLKQITLLPRGASILRDEHSGSRSAP